MVVKAIITHGEAKQWQGTQAETDRLRKMHFFYRLWRAPVENLGLRLWFRIDGEMLSGISLNLESVRLFWLALENWNVGASQNQGKAYYSKHWLLQLAPLLFLLLLLFFHLVEASCLSNGTEGLGLAEVVVGWVVLQVHPLSLKTVAIAILVSVCSQFVRQTCHQLWGWPPPCPCCQCCFCPGTSPAPEAHRAQKSPASQKSALISHNNRNSPFLDYLCQTQGSAHISWRKLGRYPATLGQLVFVNLILFNVLNTASLPSAWAVDSSWCRRSRRSPNPWKVTPARAHEAGNKRIKLPLSSSANTCQLFSTWHWNRETGLPSTPRLCNSSQTPFTRGEKKINQKAPLSMIFTCCPFIGHLLS